jgi:hypothetical protein
MTRRLPWLARSDWKKHDLPAFWARAEFEVDAHLRPDGAESRVRPAVLILRGRYRLHVMPVLDTGIAAGAKA